MLSACDWWDVFLDRQGQVRLGINRNSYWHIEVARAGTYRFRLRRWPVEAGLALDAACAETVVTDGVFEAGEALPITGARLCIDDQCQHCACEPGADCAAFTVELAARRRLLHTWFLDTRGQSLCGAYYVYIERL